MPGETAVEGAEKPIPPLEGAAGAPIAPLAGAPAPPAPPAPPASPPIADDVLKPVDPRSITVERITSWIVTGCIALGLLVAALIAVIQGPPLWILVILPLVWLAATASLGWLSERFPRWEYARKRYRLSRLGIEIHKGVWWRRVISVPRSRIQHTDVTQGPLMRRFGVASLLMHTAGTENASVELSGLGYETALALRDYLIRGGEDDGV